MNLQSLLHSRGTLAAVAVAVLASGVLAIRAKADPWDQKTVLTVSQTIQVRDTVLEPGQYVLRLLDSQSNRHVVQIFNSDQSRVLGTVIAYPAQRLEPSSDSRFTFWETPPGTARAMRTWYYPGELIGNEFPYPKHLKQLAMASTTTTAAAPAPAPAPEPPAAEPAPQPEPAPTPQASEEPTPQQPAEVAQATPPPPPAEPAPAPEPAQLPKTGSPYPLIGFAGLALLGVSGMLKLKRLV